MEFTIKLNTDQVRIVLSGLDELKHSVSRPTFDVVYQQVQQQEMAAQQANQPKSPTPNAPPANDIAPGLSD